MRRAGTRMRNSTTAENAPGEVHTRKIRKLCTQCIHPALTRDSSSPTPTPAATTSANAHTAAKNALSEWVHTQKIREKCTHCIHPALTRDSPKTRHPHRKPPCEMRLVTHAASTRMHRKLARLGSGPKPTPATSRPEGSVLLAQVEGLGNNPAAAGDHGAAASRLRHHHPDSTQDPVSRTPRRTPRHTFQP